MGYGIITLKMRKKEVVFHLKGRWQRVREREIAELRRTPFGVRFAQTSALMQFAKSLKRENGQEKNDIRSYWKRLKRRAPES